MMPGRTQSPRTSGSLPWRSVAALLQSERSPGRSRVAASNRALLVGDAGRGGRIGIGVGPVRHQRDRVDLGQAAQALPCGRETRPAGSRAGSCRCSSSGRRGAVGRSCAPRACRSAPRWWTVCQRFRREQVSRSRGSKQPSSSRTGPRQPSARICSASPRSSSAKPSAPLQARKRASDAVPVGVRLDDRPDARARRRARARARLCGERLDMDPGAIGRGIDRFCQRAHAGAFTPPRLSRPARARKSRAITPPHRHMRGRRPPPPAAPNEKRLLHHHVGAVLQLAG